MSARTNSFLHIGFMVHVSVRKETKNLLVVRTAPPPYIYTVVLLSSLIAETTMLGHLRKPLLLCSGSPMRMILNHPG